MWKCEDAPSNETAVVSSVVLCMGWTASLLQTHTKKKRKKEKKKKKPHKIDEPLVSPQQKVSGLRTNSVSFVKHCCFIALWQHPALTMKTRWWNVKLVSAEGISRTQSSIRKCIPSRNTVRAWTWQMKWKHAILPSKHLDWQNMYFFILGHLLHLPS